MVSPGRKAAFNMDGGKTGRMVVGDTLVNTPYKDGRECSDYITVMD